MGRLPRFHAKGCAIAVLHGEHMTLVAGELAVTYDGHPGVTLSPGTYAYGPAKLPHHAVCGGSGPCVLFIGFESPLDAIAGAPQ